MSTPFWFEPWLITTPLFQPSPTGPRLLPPQPPAPARRRNSPGTP